MSRRWLPRPGLLARLTLGLALVGLLPLALVSQRLVGLNEEALTHQVESLHSVSARTTAERIGQFLESRQALALGLATDPALIEPRSPAAQGVLRRSLGAWEKLGIEGLVIVNRSGEEVIRAQLSDPEARRRVEAAVAAPLGRDVVLLSESQPPVVRLQAETAGGAALLWLTCDGREVAEALANYELGENADLMLVGPSRRALIGEQELVDDFPIEVLDYALANWLSGVKRDFRSARDGRQFIGAWAPVPQAGWAVLSRQPLAVAQRVAQRMRRQSILAVGGAVVLIVLLSLAAWGSVIRPIRELTRAQRRLAGLPAPARGGDEIAQLRAAFEALEQRLSSQENVGEVFLGRYQVKDVLGSGAMGTVFRGFDPKLQRQVAIKTVRLDRKLQGSKRQELVQRLLKEAITVARFNHPNIVNVFDVEDHPEGAFVAMELVEGNSLELAIWEHKRLSAPQVVPLGAAIARALAAAHEHDIVHRDIKPANVLLGRDGSIKVTDFGISELISSLAPPGDFVFGTPGFVPPETLRGQGYEQSGDLFSLGSVLYACLVGRPPFEGHSIKEVVRRTLFGVVEPPGRLVSGVPPELDQIIMELLHRDQQKRPAAAAEVAERLEAVARSYGFVWRPPGHTGDRQPSEDELQPSHWLPTTRLGEAEPAGGRS